MAKFGCTEMYRRIMSTHHSLLIIILLLSTGYIRCQTVYNVQIPAGQPYDVINPTYPQNMGWADSTLEWNLQVEDGAQIKFVCKDLRLTQTSPWTEDCPEVYLSLEDSRGMKKVCGSPIIDFIYRSDGPKLKIKAMSTEKGSGMFKCVALNMGDPKPEEIVEMDPHKSVRRFVINGNPETPLPRLDRLLEFKSTPGTRMSLQCDFTIRNKKPMCGWNAVTFYNGESYEEICEYKRVVLFSKTNKAKLRIQLDDNGWGSMNCLVQAITGPSPNEYENIKSAEADSSEDGVTPGVKQTSCKCGWSNKSGARIIKGHEARVNEYPWMVHMFITHDDEGEIREGTCGASIITQRHILTAAHCLVIGREVVPAEKVRMVLADHDSTKPTGKEITIRAEKIFIREPFLQNGLDYDDIALIFTKETIEYSTIVGPVCIEPKPDQLINRDVIIMGWGITEDGDYSTYLRKGISRVMDPILCGYSPWDVCTTSKPSSVCSGDSGGPLVWLDPETNRYSQVSLVSRGNSCTDKFMLSTLVSYYYDWIQQVINETEPSMKTCHKI